MLERMALCILSDSGTITEESSLLNVPAVTIREAHERSEGMDEATVILSGQKSERVLQAVKLAIAHAESPRRPFRVVTDYDTDNASKKVVRIIVGYIDYVNRTVWHKLPIQP
jgi:UDP-N-acetylglucosamine 2-epimerase (non-hydrolysing)